MERPPRPDLNHAPAPGASGEKYTIGSKELAAPMPVRDADLVMLRLTFQKLENDLKALAGQLNQVIAGIVMAQGYKAVIEYELERRQKIETAGIPAVFRQ